MCNYDHTRAITTCPFKGKILNDPLFNECLTADSVVFNRVVNHESADGYPCDGEFTTCKYYRLEQKKIAKGAIK